MYFLSRSSRATGPKMRVPRGGAVRVDQNGCVLIELDVAAVGTTNFLLHANDHAADDVALLHVGVRRGFFNAADDDIAQSRVTALRAAQDLDALHLASAGVIGHCEHGLHLNHCFNLTFISIVFRDERARLLGLLDDLHEAPALHLRQRTRFHDLNGVAEAGFVVLVMGMELHDEA